MLDFNAARIGIKLEQHWKKGELLVQAAFEKLFLATLLDANNRKHKVNTPLEKL